MALEVYLSYFWFEHCPTLIHLDTQIVMIDVGL